MRASTETAYLLADALGFEISVGDKAIAGKGSLDLTLGATGAWALLPFKIIGSTIEEQTANVVVEGPGNLALFVQARSLSVEVHVLDRSLVAYPLQNLLGASDFVDVLKKSVKASWTGKRALAYNTPIAWEKVPLDFA